MDRGIGAIDIVIVAGEASGDLLGADLIDGLRSRFPHARFHGVGGAAMIRAGLESWHPMEALSVMGLAEVVRHLPRLLRIRRDVIARSLKLRPAIYVGIDAPDFNLGVERRLKRQGIATVHHVSPSVWAWREGRARTIGGSADIVLCVFPMEPEIYARHGVAARFVGHPLARQFPLHPDHAAARQALSFDAARPLLAVLPGSRRGEIARLGRDFIEAVRRLADELPDLQVVAPMATRACRDAFESLLDTDDRGRIRVIDGESHRAMLAADAVLLASGTAALEAMLAKRPMVVAYRLSPITHWLVRRLGLLKVQHYSLPNVLAGKPVVPELMQYDCQPERIASALLPMLRARRIDPLLLAAFERIHGELTNTTSAAVDAVAARIVASAR